MPLVHYRNSFLVLKKKMADDLSLPACSTTETLTAATEEMSVSLSTVDAGQAMTLTVSHFPVEQVDETGDGNGKLCHQSAASLKKESGLFAF